MAAVLWLKSLAAIWLCGLVGCTQPSEADSTALESATMHSNWWKGSASMEGWCGAAFIRISGMDPHRSVGLEHFQQHPDGASLAVLINGESLSFDGLLSDYNTLRCVSSPHTAMLLIGSLCSGSLCGDYMNYTVVDLTTGDMSPDVDDCHEACANSLLGFSYFAAPVL